MRSLEALAAPLLLVAGLVGCEHSVKDAAHARGLSVKQANASVAAAIAAATPNSAPGQAQGEAPGQAPGEAPGVAVAMLPLKRGYYVASDTPCSRASNATVSLLQRGGIGGSRDFCEFERIEQTGPLTFRVVQACKAFQDNGPAQTSIVVYAVLDDASFSSRSEDGWEYSARHCAQSSMPPEWRQNDIRDALR